jgi:catechol-2,3-dioxygenase
MIKLQRLAHVLIAVRDLEASKRWYMDVLGLSFLEQDPEHGGVFLAVGDNGNAVDLFQSIAPDATPPSASDGETLQGLGVKHVAFAVVTEKELEDAYFVLKDKGVTIQRALDHESQKSIYFFDPDGNLLEICWERPNALELFARGREDINDPVTFVR